MRYEKKDEKKKLNAHFRLSNGFLLFYVYVCIVHNLPAAATISTLRAHIFDLNESYCLLAIESVHIQNGLVVASFIFSACSLSLSLSFFLVLVVVVDNVSVRGDSIQPFIVYYNLASAC